MDDPLSERPVAALYVSGPGDWGEPGYLGVKVQVAGVQYGFVLSQAALRQLGLVVDQVLVRRPKSWRSVELVRLVEGGAPVVQGPLEEL